MKSKKGITLITLVITIVILIIIAGVSINAIVGENGIITRTKKAAQELEKAMAVEDVKIAWQSLEIDYVAREDTTQTKEEFFTAEKLEELLNSGTISDEVGSFVFAENGISKLTYINEKGNEYVVEVTSTGEAYVVDQSIVVGENEFVQLDQEQTIMTGTAIKVISTSKLTWESGDTSIVEITEDGNTANIIGKAAGNTMVSAKNNNGTDVIKYVLTVQEGQEALNSSSRPNNESLLTWIRATDTTGYYDVQITVDGTQYTYPVYLKVIEGDTTYSSNTSLQGGLGLTEFGNNIMDKRILIYKYKGNLTINANVKVTVATTKTCSKYTRLTKSGSYDSVTTVSYDGPLGLFLYVEGTFINNGTVTMKDRGAQDASSSLCKNIILWKFGTESPLENYYYVPKSGGSDSKYTSWTNTYGTFFIMTIHMIDQDMDL